MIPPVAHVPSGAARLPTVQPEREPMKLAEALALGRSAQRLVNLSTAHARLSGGGSVTVKTTDGNLTYALTGIDIEAVLALLIEREVAFLTPYNVECLS